MWIQVRGLVGGEVKKVPDLSRTTPIQQLRHTLKNWGPSSHIRLFCKGKEMLDGYTLFDYNVGLNDMVLVLVKKKLDESKDGEKKLDEIKDGEKEGDDRKDEYIKDDNSEKENINKDNDNRVDDDSVDDINKDDAVKNDKECHDDDDDDVSNNKEEGISDTKTTSAKYKPGDVVDVREADMGAWFEADVIKVIDQSQKEDSKQNGAKEDHDGFVYHVKFEGEDDVTITSSNHIRFRAHHKISFENLKIGDNVMVNYNYDQPKERGYWYDSEITAKESRGRKIKATVFIGKELIGMKECRIIFTDEIFSISSLSTPPSPSSSSSSSKAPIRISKPDCDHCQDDANAKCKECSCTVCGGKSNPHLQILCDECGVAYHIACLTPPLSAVPSEDDWFCPDCKLDRSVVVGAGQKLKESARKSKMASASCKKDWGKGMACVGRTKVCSIVPQNHFGAIPGVEVGTLWKYRVQVSEAGIHRPHVAGIHGRENEGSYSIVLSGGYEDDKDDGEEFTYTGSGGRDLSGNKRTAGQSCDQVLNRMNKALAKNCDCPVNAKEGSKAVDWRKGKAVRVVRNCKGRKHSKYAPEEGNRYDGIYKVVSYWPSKGMSGFLVWKFLLRRDDPIPPPWSKEGQKRSLKLGLIMQYPDGYEEKASKSGQKRKKGEEDEKEEEGGGGDDDDVKKKKTHKKAKTDKLERNTEEYQLEDELTELIKEDEVNEKMWTEVTQVAKGGKKAILDEVVSRLTCVCCQELPHPPITTPCHHHFCKKCLERSFKAGVKTCGMCRQELDDGADDGGGLKVNIALSKILKYLFPCYEVGR